MWPLGPSRFDALMWAVGVAVAAVGTFIAWAAGARLGAALTLGVMLLIAVIVAALLLDSRSHGAGSLPGPDDD